MNSVSLGLCVRFPSHSGSKRPAIPRGAGRAYHAPIMRGTWEAIMQFTTTGLLLLGAMALPASGIAQTTPAPPTITRTVVAASRLPTVTDVPLHFKAVRITLQTGREERRLGGQRHPLPDVRID